MNAVMRYEILQYFTTSVKILLASDIDVGYGPSIMTRLDDEKKISMKATTECLFFFVVCNFIHQESVFSH